MSAIGIVTVSERAVMQIAAHIAKQHDGVKRLTDKKSGDGITRAIKGSRDTKGVYILKSKQGLALEICIICSYGINTVRLCADITKRIRSELCEVGFRIKEINVRIMGVE